MHPQTSSSSSIKSFFNPNDASLLAGISNVLTMRVNITKINGKCYMTCAIDHLPYGPPFNVGTFLLQTVFIIQKIPE